MHLDVVAPFTGAWIEIGLLEPIGIPSDVAPFTGAWIEIALMMGISGAWMSLPSRERGLKSGDHIMIGLVPRVAPFTGAWIEI